MRTLSKAGWFCIGATVLLWGIAFLHYNGVNTPLPAVIQMLASVFWGGIVLAGAFLFLMAVLFLSA